MNHPFSNRRAIALAMLSALLGLLACTPPQPDASSTNPPLGEGSRTFDADVSFGSGAIDFAETTAGLADLASYRATLTLSFDGQDAGQPSTWTKTYTMIASKDPAVRELRLEKSSNHADTYRSFIIEAEGTTYEQRGEDACLVSAVVEGESLASRMEPAALLSGVMGADDAGTDTLPNGQASHYTFDEHALTQPTPAPSKGEMWVASDGGYIVKYSLATTGAADYFGEGIEGTVTWAYELTDINQPVSIKIPEDCGIGMVNAPLIPDAVGIQSAPGALSFDSAQSMADVVAFYQKELPDLGWEQLQEPIIDDTSTTLQYADAEKTMVLLISTDAGTTSVYLAVAKE